MVGIENVRKSWANITGKLLRDKRLLAHVLSFSTGMLFKRSMNSSIIKVGYIKLGGEVFCFM